MSHDCGITINIINQMDYYIITNGPGFTIVGGHFGIGPGRAEGNKLCVHSVHKKLLLW